MIYTIDCGCSLQIRPDQKIGNYCVFCKNLHIKNDEKDIIENERVVEDNSIGETQGVDNEDIKSNIKPIRKSKKK